MTPITERFALSGETANLVVTVPSGTVRLTESPDPTVTVEIEGKGADQVEVTAVGDDITISHKDHDRRFLGFGGGVTIRVQLPTGSDLRLATASANLLADVGLGEVRCSTASGDLRLAKVAGSLEAKSASGDISASVVGGAVKASLASGDVRVKKVRGDLQVNTASGEVRIEKASGDVRAKSASGDIILGLWTGHDLWIRTVSGSARLAVPTGTRADLSLRSMSGDIRLPDTPSPPAGETRIERRLSFASVSGDFVLGVE